MAEELETIDLWGVLDEAEQTVERWEAWRQEYEVDVYRDAMERRALSPPQ